MRIALFSLLLVLTIPAQAQIYKYTDEKGNTVFTNQPPEGVAAETVDLPPANTVDIKVPDAPPPLTEEQAGDRQQAYRSLSIGGIIKHGKALNGFTNPSTNSYKRLVPGFEAPVMLAYSARNRSASIRIPYVSSPKARRIEARFPDPAANPYLCFAALLMAGLDGIQNKIHPGDAADKNLYDLPPEEGKLIPQVCGSLKEALEELDKGRAFLTKGGVFSDDFIDAYLELKSEEEIKVRTFVHPLEYDLYYSV